MKRILAIATLLIAPKMKIFLLTLLLIFAILPITFSQSSVQKDASAPKAEQGGQPQQPASQQAAQLPKGWINGAPSGSKSEDYEMGLDTTEKHSGKASAFIRLKAASSSGFATLAQGVKADNYRGKRVRLSAYLKAENVEGWAGLWMRVDSENRMLEFDNMMNRPVKGTTGWLKYEVTLDVPETSVYIPFGFLLVGKGRVWADNFQLEVVDKNVPATNMEEAVKSSEEYQRPQAAQSQEKRRQFLAALPDQPTNLDFES